MSLLVPEPDAAPGDEAVLDPAAPGFGSPGLGSPSGGPDGELTGGGRSITRRGVALIGRFVRMHPGPFALSLVGGVGWAAIVVAASYVLGRVTDEVITPAFTEEGLPASTVWWAVAALFLVGLARGISFGIRRWFGSLTEARTQRSVRTDVVERLLTMPLSSYRRRPTGELLANADVDVTTASNMLMPLPFSLGVVALIVISLVSLFMADPAFGVVALLLFPTLTLISRWYTNRVHEPAALTQARLGDVSAIAHESFDGVLVVKTLGREAQEQDRFDAAADRLRSQRLVVARLTSSFEPLLDMLPNLGTVVLLVAGAWRIDQGGATPGDLVQAVALFSDGLRSGCAASSSMFEQIPGRSWSIARVDAPGARRAGRPGRVESRRGVVRPGRTRRPRVRWGLALDDACSAYEGRRRRGARRPPMSIRGGSGQLVGSALQGRCGGGKSTFMQLLVRPDELFLRLRPGGRNCGRGADGGGSDPTSEAPGVAGVPGVVYLLGRRRSGARLPISRPSGGRRRSDRRRAGAARATAVEPSSRGRRDVVGAERAWPCRAGVAGARPVALARRRRVALGTTLPLGGRPADRGVEIRGCAGDTTMAAAFCPPPVDDPAGRPGGALDRGAWQPNSRQEERKRDEL